MTMANAKAGDKGAEKGVAGAAPQSGKENGAPKVEGTTPPESRKALWEELTKAENAAVELQSRLDRVNEKKSSIIERIKATQGAGPFQVPGLGLVAIRARKTKDENDMVTKTTYYLARLTGTEVTVIE